MKFWTVQKKEVIEVVNKEGIYQSDFSKSDYLKIIPKLKDLYYIVLDAFNQVNEMHLQGVVFAFLQGNGEKVYSFENYENFYTYIQNKADVISGFWKQISKNDVVVVELDYEEKFNPILVDINDFQFLMPPITLLCPYTRQDVNRIITEMRNGQITRSKFPSNVIQAHLPYIRKENITNIYPMFELE